MVFDQPRSSVNDDLDELYAFLNWTQNSIDNNKWGMIIIHDVVPFFQLDSLLNLGIYEPITNEWLGWLCDWLAVKSLNKKVWIETVGNITRYIKERENSEYQVVSSANELIEISLTDNLDNIIYNYPLSAYIKVPENWQVVETEQNGIIDTLTTVNTDSGKVVLVKVIPDNGVLKLIPLDPSSIVNENIGPKDFRLFQNYPNPFNPSTKISWQTSRGGWQTLKIYDLLGREVATLVDEFKPAGIYEIIFSRGGLPSGIYYYQLKTGNYIATKKMVVLK